ncbi:MAG TPA: hypothetical protein VFL64_00440 [Rhizobacter sp.]|nr:hypothetical protein [Rhizobacter sp.]
MTDTAQAQPGAIGEAESLARAKLGRWVTYFALAAISLLALTAILVSLPGGAESKERYAHAKDILTIVLPVMGTWVGTVLAFYFSRENFVAAATQTANLVRQLTPDQQLQGISVTAAMLDMSNPAVKKLTLADLSHASTMKLKADVVDALLEKDGRNRLPILDKDGKVLFVLHRSFIDKFLVSRAELGGTALADATLEDLLNDPTLKLIFQSFVVVGRSARLLAVKQAMDGNPNCSDAFVTQDGTRASTCVGWITNVMVREHSLPVAGQDG